jgi:hypothetical protein
VGFQPNNRDIGKKGEKSPLDCIIIMEKTDIANATMILTETDDEEWMEQFCVLS